MKHAGTLKVAVLFAVMSGVVSLASSYARESLTSVPIGSVKQHLKAPARIGPWSSVAPPDDVVEPWVDNGQDAAAAEVYDQLIMKSYKRNDGAEVTLVLAYKHELLQEDRIHRPEICYYAQGYHRSQFTSDILQYKGAPIPLVGFLASNNNRKERVLYWMRSGNLITEDPFYQRLKLLEDNLNGTIPDGILVRASINSNSESPTDTASLENRILKDFLRDLLRNMPEGGTRILVGR